MEKVFILDDSQERLEKFHDKLTGKASLFFATNSKDAIALLDTVIFDWAFLDHDLGGQVMVESVKNTGYEVALWLQEHPERMPKNIVIHSLNPSGAKRMSNCLPKAQILPCAWDYL